MLEQVLPLRSRVREQVPLIHCLTNPISINDCANTVLAVGARPIMAEHPGEVAEITAGADALLLNLGNITDVRMRSMQISAETAKSRGIPIVLDLVGVGCSTLRLGFARELADRFHPELIKGNLAEIIALGEGRTVARGVDARAADEKAEPDYLCKLAAATSAEEGTAVLISGPVDAVAGGQRAMLCRNGHPMLAALTGTGCMLGALAAAYMAVGGAVEAAALAALTMGIAGELAGAGAGGTGSFHIGLLDALSAMEDNTLRAMAWATWLDADDNIE